MHDRVFAKYSRTRIAKAFFNMTVPHTRTPAYFSKEQKPTALCYSDDRWTVIECTGQKLAVEPTCIETFFAFLKGRVEQEYNMAQEG